MAIQQDVYNIQQDVYKINRITQVLALISALLGLVVVLSWHATKTSFFKIPSFIFPMPYNTALSLLLYSMAVIFFLKKFKKTAFIIVVVVGMAHVLFFLQPPVTIDLGIHTPFIEKLLKSTPLLPMPTAPSASINFLLLSVVFILIIFPRATRLFFVNALLLTITVLALALMVIINHFAGLPTDFGWTQWAYLDVHTAIGMLLLDGAILGTIYQEIRTKGIDLSGWLPFMVAFCCLLSTSLLWLGLKAEEEMHLRQLVQATAESVKKIILTGMEERVEALNRMAFRLARRKINQEEWLSDANHYIHDQEGYKAVGLVDKQFHLQKLTPFQVNKNYIGINLLTIKPYQSLLTAAKTQQRPFISSVGDYLNYHQVFLVMSPIFNKQSFKGIVIGVIDPTALLNSLLSDFFSENYRVVIVENHHRLYSLNSESVDHYQQDRVVEKVFIDNEVQWQIDVAPTANLYALTASWLPNFGLLIGYILAFLLALLTRLVHVARDNIDKINTNQKDLELAHLRLSGIIESTQDLIAAFDLSHCCIAYNKPFSYFYQQIFSSVLYYNACLPDEGEVALLEQKNYLKAWQRALAGEAFTVYLNFRMDAPRKLIRYEMRFSPIHNKEGQLIGAAQMATEISERLKVQLALKKAKDELEQNMIRLENYNAEVISLNEMNSVLQHCLNLKEAYEVIINYCQDVLHIKRGALYMVEPDLKTLKMIVSWGDIAHDKQAFSLTDCWALRRDQLYLVDKPHAQVCCEHVKNLKNNQCPYLCIPMWSHGEALGIIYFQFPDSASAKLEETRLTIMQMLTEQVGLSINDLRLRDKLHEQSIRDPLTGLFNRRYLQEHLMQQISYAERLGTRFFILLLDIDHFKQINDKYGHPVGDDVLMALSQLLMEKFRSYDTVCRYGGEEFIVCINQADDLSRVIKRAEAFCKRVKALKVNTNEGTLAHITVSIGIAQYPDDGKEQHALIDAADKALYLAKTTGRDQVMAYKNG